MPGERTCSMSIVFLVGAWRVLAQDRIVLGTFSSWEKAHAFALALKSQD